MRWLVVLATLAASATTSAAPCPSSRAALVALGRTAFPADRRTVGDTVLPLDAQRLHCTAVHGHATLALVTYRASDDIVLGALVREQQVVWSDVGAEDCTPCITDQAFSLVDLDGDGDDELLVRARKTGHMAMTVEWVAVSTIGKDGVPATAQTFLLRNSASHQGSEQGQSLDYACSSSLKILPGPANTHRLELVGRCTGAAAPPDYPTGRHVYTFP